MVLPQLGLVGPRIHPRRHHGLGSIGSRGFALSLWRGKPMVILVASVNFIFNGQNYESIDQMPPEAREQYLRLVATLGDANGNGIPDFAEGKGTSVVSLDERINFNGREYQSLNQLPPEVRNLIARMPLPKPGESQTRAQVERNMPGFEIGFTTFQSGNLPRLTRRIRSNSSWLLVGLLIAIILVLLTLWLAGIRPEELFR